MRDVAVVSWAQSPIVRDAGAQNEVELIMPVVSKALADAGLNSVQDVDFTCSGSCDYLQGASFAFVAGVDALGAVPPIKESHVEMDAAWALYEAWLKIQMGHAESALIYGFAKSSPGELPNVLSLQLDPYYQAPLWPDSISLAGLQARIMLDPNMPELTGTHDRRGVIIAAGPAFRSVGYVEGATILDVAPTSLAVLGLPVTGTMDGRILSEFIEPAHLEHYPTHIVEGYGTALGRSVETEEGSSMDESIKDQLRSLGYIQ